jgi:hypothetical protein
MHPVNILRIFAFSIYTVVLKGIQILTIRYFSSLVFLEHPVDEKLTWKDQIENTDLVRTCIRSIGVLN